MNSALKLARKLHDTFGRIPDKEAIAIALELKDQVMIESAGEPVAKREPRCTGSILETYPTAGGAATPDQHPQASQCSKPDNYFCVYSTCRNYPIGEHAPHCPDRLKEK